MDEIRAGLESIGAIKGEWQLESIQVTRGTGSIAATKVLTSLHHDLKV